MEFDGRDEERSIEGHKGPVDGWSRLAKKSAGPILASYRIDSGCLVDKRMKHWNIYGFGFQRTHEKG